MHCTSPRERLCSSSGVRRLHNLRARIGEKVMPSPEPAGIVPSDLLPLLRKSQILTERQFEEIRAKVLGGTYPLDSKVLADRLVAEKILTRFQADRLLRNKVHGLIIDRYVILERLGSGAKGRIFKAE